MQYTGNYNLKKYDDTDAADPVAINDNMDIVDGELAKRASLVGGVVPLPQLPVLPYPVNTFGSGSAYTATIDGITTLTKGLLITIIPHTSSTSVSPTLNLNGLGAKTIKRRYSYTNNSTSDGQSSNWLTSAKPQLLQYDGTYWIAIGANKPYGPDMYGTVGVSTGGTGKTSWTSYRLIYPSGTTTLTQLAFPSISGSVLRQGTSGAPYWTAPTDLQVGQADRADVADHATAADSVGGYTFVVSSTIPTDVVPGRITFVYE